MLIAKTRKVDRVLGLLSVAVLDIEQYQSIMAEKTDRGRMEKLFDLVPQWKNTRYKDELLWAIKATQFLNCSDITGNLQKSENEHPVVKHRGVHAKCRGGRSSSPWE